MFYQNMGVFDEIAGLLVARPYGMNADATGQFWRVVDDRTAPFTFPIVGNLDIGPTSPQMTLPLGVNARIDGKARTIRIIESAVAEG